MPGLPVRTPQRTAPSEGIWNSWQRQRPFERERWPDIAEVLPPPPAHRAFLWLILAEAIWQENQRTECAGVSHYDTQQSREPMVQISMEETAKI